MKILNWTRRGEKRMNHVKYSGHTLLKKELIFWNVSTQRKIEMKKFPMKMCILYTQFQMFLTGNNSTILCYPCYSWIFHFYNLVSILYPEKNYQLITRKLKLVNYKQKVMNWDCMNPQLSPIDTITEND